MLCNVQACSVEIQIKIQLNEFKVGVLPIYRIHVQSPSFAKNIKPD